MVCSAHLVSTERAVGHVMTIEDTAVMTPYLGQLYICTDCRLYVGIMYTVCIILKTMAEML